MRIGRDAAIWYLAVISVFLLGLIRFARMPVWTAIVLGAVFVTVSTLLAARHCWHYSGQRSPDAGTATEPEAAPQAQPEKTQITETRLPSNRRDYDFMFSAAAWWSPVRGNADASLVNMPALARDAILRRAREVTESRDPQHVSLVQHELASTLGELLTDRSGRVYVMATDIQLVVPDEDRERLAKLATVRKDKDVWEHERSHELDKREYLGKDVLKDPGSAVVWWLARNEDQVRQTADNIDLLTELSHAANNTSSGPPSSEKSAADYLESFLKACEFPGAPVEQRVFFAHRIAKLAAEHELTEIGEEILARFGIPDQAEPPQEPGDGLSGG